MAIGVQDAGMSYGIGCGNREVAGAFDEKRQIMRVHQGIIGVETDPRMGSVCFKGIVSFDDQSVDGRLFACNRGMAVSSLSALLEGPSSFTAEMETFQPPVSGSAGSSALLHEITQRQVAASADKRNLKLIFIAMPSYQSSC